MPKKALLNAPNALAIAQSITCRDEVELLGCRSTVKALAELLEHTEGLCRTIDKAKALIEAKIKKYEEEL